MIEKSPYKSGDLVPIYRDPETELIKMGMARLRELRTTGLPIILEEQTEAEQRIYVIEDWIIEWDQVDYKLMRDSPWLFREDKPHKLMRLYKVGP